MYTNILVPLDGSALAETALPYARAIATRTGARLTLIRSAGHMSLFGDMAPAQQRLLTKAEEYLDGLAADLRREGFTVATGVPFAGHAAQWIVEECQVRRADLIVMASHDRVGVDRWLHGSVAETVIHKANAPVMLVKGTTTQAAAERLASEAPVVVVPLDQSVASEAALPVATQMALAFDARLVLVSVVPVQLPVTVGYPAMVAYEESDYIRMETDAREYLQAIAAPLEERGIDVQTLVRIGDAGTEIASVAEQDRAAVVVMATHARAGVVRSMLGSVAGAVVHCGTTPVVLIRPRQAREARVPRIEAVAHPVRHR